MSKVARFLQGRHAGVAEELEQLMQEAAADLDYELAARYRNRLEAVRSIEERQKIVTETRSDVDVIGIVREETIAGVHVFVVREGRVLIGNEFILDKGLDVPHAELVEGFLLRYYDEASHVPKEILIPGLPCDPIIDRGLACRSAEEPRSRSRCPRRARSAVSWSLPRRTPGMRCSASRSARATTRSGSTPHCCSSRAHSHSRLRRMRIESFDISTLHGRHSVGSMVVFAGGRPDPKSYRRFRVRMDTGQSNDVAMMGEVLSPQVLRPAHAATRASPRGPIS